MVAAGQTWFWHRGSLGLLIASRPRDGFSYALAAAAFDGAPLTGATRATAMGGTTTMCRIPRVILLPGMVLLLSLAVLSLGPQPSFAKLTATASTAHGSRQAAHYIVFQRQPDGTIAPLHYRQVQLAAALETLSDSQLARHLAQPDRHNDQLVVTLQSAGGQTVYQSIVRVPRWLRGEFHGSADDGAIDGVWLPIENAAFVVRVPRIEGTTLSVKDSRFNLNQLAAQTPPINLDAMAVAHTIAGTTGNPANRVDLLVMGDGYTAAQATDFANDAASVISQFFGISPYAEYANYVDTHSLFTASNQSGADHPPYDAGCSYLDPTCCADPAILADPLQGAFVDTAFDSVYCTSNIHRLLTANAGDVYAAAAAMPDWDAIMLLVNDSTYGGSGGPIITASMNPFAVEIAQHEYAHSFAGLADEYESPYPGYPACSDISGPSPCEPNVTDVNTRHQIKWSPWISPTTPVPTVPEFDPQYADVVGLFEGARYLSSGMYRPGQDCIMHSLGRPYCQVPSQAYVLKLYDGGWGVPWSGISLIEPGTTFPVTSSITLTRATTQVFQADILQPAGGPPVQITWLVDSVPVPGATSSALTYTATAVAGDTVEIEIRAQDMTALVHPAMAGTSLRSVYTWQISTAAAPYSVYLPVMQRS